MGPADGSCGTTLYCSDCPAISVLRVIDEDTFTTSGNQNVRLFEVDTPERGEKCYREATARSLLRTEARYFNANASSSILPSRSFTIRYLPVLRSSISRI